MSRKVTTSVSALGLAVGAVLAVGLAAPASAAPVPYPVDIISHVEFEVDPGPFESNIPDCESGWVHEGPSSTRFTPWGGVYSGLK